MNNSAIDRLTVVLQKLTTQAIDTDQANARLKSHKLIENNALFSNSLFVTQSDKFSPYLTEIARKIAELRRLMNAGQLQIATAALTKIEQQISALFNALNANNTMHAEAKIRQEGRNRTFNFKKYKKAAQAVLQPSHQLHQKLAEHHGFERRLLDMITDREQQRTSSSVKNSQALSEQVLVLHQRLGRCRKAISDIERDIEYAQKR